MAAAKPHHQDKEAGRRSPINTRRLMRCKRRSVDETCPSPVATSDKQLKCDHPFGDIDDEKQRDVRTHNDSKEDLDLELIEIKSTSPEKNMQCTPMSDMNVIFISDSDEDHDKNEDLSMTNSPQPPSPPAPRHRLQQRLKKNVGSNILEMSRLLRACQSEVNPSPLDDTTLMVPPPDVLQEITAKVRCHSKVYRIKLLPDECFHTVVSHIALTLEVEAASVSLFLHEKEISSTDTPLSVQLSITDIIECIITKTASAGKGPPLKSANTIALKVQSREKNSTQIITIGKTEPLSMLMEKYTAQVGPNKQRFMFELDGEELDGNSTPHQLDLEDGDLIDVRVM